VFTKALVIGPSHVAPQLGPKPTAFQLTLGLPELFSTRRGEPVALPLDLVLTPADNAPYAYVLGIPAGSRVWDFTDRPDVIATWGEALTELQSLGLTPYGFAALTEAVSRSMPQTFAETLYFAYGLRFDRGYLDLRPGLVLRVEYESYQTVQAETAVSGFVTGGVAEYEVASYDNDGTRTNGLDAFLAQLTLQNGLEVPDPVWPGQGQLYGSGGVADLFASPLRERPYARLVFPPRLQPAIPSSKGSTRPQDNCVLLAAAGLDELDRATEAVRARAAPTGVAAAYLRGRAVVRAMVRVSVNGAPRLVPVGTTLGNLLASEGRRPPAVPLPLSGVAMHRPGTAAVLADGSAGDWPVLPGWQPRDPAALDLPLLHGDRLELTTDHDR
jgi:sulfur carrier protein ThiS